MEVKQMSMDDHSSAIMARLPITVGALASLRAMTIAAACAAGLAPDRAENFALAVNEAATNTIRYAHGTGRLVISRDDDRHLYADVTDTGPGMSTPTGEVRPLPDAAGGRGLWLSRHFCDRIAIRTGAAGTAVRLEMDLHHR
jgi:serine/threonine-protein kinase RsbW